MKSKHPLASKSIWGFIIMLLGALLGWSETLQGDLLQFIDEIIQLVGVGAALYGRLAAQTKLDWKAPLKQKKLTTPKSRLPVFLPLLFAPLLMQGCASAETSGVIDIGQLKNDLYIVDIGSNAQMPTEGGTDVDLDTTPPIGGVPTPLDLAIKRTGLLSGQSLRVDTVGGSIIIQRAFVGTQNVPLEKVMPKVFVPSVNPLGDLETTTTVETIEEN